MANEQIKHFLNGRAMNRLNASGSSNQKKQHSQEWPRWRHVISDQVKQSA